MDQVSLQQCSVLVLKGCDVRYDMMVWSVYPHQSDSPLEKQVRSAPFPGSA